jgi:hypothetical protein
VDDHERAVEIERLLKERSDATARQTALLEEAQEFAARIHEIRAAFGDPSFYSDPENADESAAHYSGPAATRQACPHSSLSETLTVNWARSRSAFQIGISLEETE